MQRARVYSYRGCKYISAAAAPVETRRERGTVMRDPRALQWISRVLHPFLALFLSDPLPFPILFRCSAIISRAFSLARSFAPSWPSARLPLLAPSGRTRVILLAAVERRARAIVRGLCSLCAGHTEATAAPDEAGHVRRSSRVRPGPVEAPLISRGFRKRSLLSSSPALIY